MNWAEFEEKEYEAPLYNQLEHGTRLVWSPGLVFEEHIGIDRAMFLSDPRIWRLLGTTNPPGGMYLPRYDWDFIWRHRSSRRTFPNFRLNLFIQAKRPQFSPRIPRKLNAVMPAGSCYKISISNDQQAALARVAQRGQNRALVCYAAPVFHRHSQLWAHTQTGTIIENSTFPDAARLSGHSAWWYNVAGACGHANPDWESIEDADLFSRINQAQRDSQNNASVSENLAELDALLVSSVKDAFEKPNSRVAAWFEERRTIDAHFKEYDLINTPLAHFMYIASFAATFNTKWYVI